MHSSHQRRNKLPLMIEMIIKGVDKIGEKVKCQDLVVIPLVFVKLTFFRNSKIKLMAWVITFLTLGAPPPP